MLFAVCCLSDSAFASAKTYDGIWFLGFNLKKQVFQDLKVRQAVAHCINKKYISNVIMSEEAIPDSIIPPTMPGYDPELSPYKQNIAFAKLLMRRAKVGMDDPRIKKLSLLHTDGIKTIEIVNKIKKDLKKIGMEVILVQVSYLDQDKWVQELKSGKHDLFVMGYKAGIEQLFTTTEAYSTSVDSYSLLQPIFGSKGSANFLGFTNAKVDLELDKVKQISPVLKKEREQKFKAINRMLYKQLPIIVIFYIEKL